MKIYVKYKTGGYEKEQRFLDTNKMYAWNGHVFRQLCDWAELMVCIEKNKSIMVLGEPVGGYISEGNVDQCNDQGAMLVEFIINPSSIAMVFPLDDRVWKVAEDDNAV